MLSRSGSCTVLLLFAALQGSAVAEKRAISADHLDFASRIAQQCTETETLSLPRGMQRDQFCICYGGQFAIGLTAEELRTLDLGSELADQKSRAATEACGAPALALSVQHQELANRIAAGCEKLEFQDVPPEQCADFCNCMGEQTVLGLTDDELRITRMGKDPKQGEAITGEKTRLAAEKCGAEITK